MPHTAETSALEAIAPFWMLLPALMGTTLLALAVLLGVAVWRGRPNVPTLLPIVSPIVAFSIFSIPARHVPAPLGSGVALMASTAGGAMWSLALLLGSRKHAALVRGTPEPR